MLPTACPSPSTGATTPDDYSHRWATEARRNSKSTTPARRSKTVHPVGVIPGFGEVLTDIDTHPRRNTILRLVQIERDLLLVEPRPPHSYLLPVAPRPDPKFSFAAVQFSGIRSRGRKQDGN
jgi:hypothetical protein